MVRSSKAHAVSSNASRRRKRAGDAFCAWEFEEQTFGYARIEQALAQLCGAESVILARAPSPMDAHCASPRTIDANDLARFGGGFIFLENGALRIERAWSQGVRRLWMPRTPASDQE